MKMEQYSFNLYVCITLITSKIQSVYALREATCIFLVSGQCILFAHCYST